MSAMIEIHFMMLVSTTPSNLLVVISSRSIGARYVPSSKRLPIMSLRGQTNLSKSAQIGEPLEFHTKG
jgi:hypothetical protein